MTSRAHRVLVLLALAAFAAFYSLAAYSLFDALMRPGPGLAFFDRFDDPDSVGAVPIAPTAVAETEDLEGILRVVSVNGRTPREIVGAGVGQVPVRVRAYALEPGRVSNTFLLQDAEGRRVSVVLPIETPSFEALPPILFFGLAYQLVGLFYLAVGLWVWGRRPHDRAATWLALIGVVAAIHLAQPAPDTALGRHLNLFAAGMLPLYGPLALRLAMAFTQIAPRPTLIRLRRVLEPAAVGLALATGAAFEAYGRGLVSNVPFRAVIALSGIELTCAIAGFSWVCWRAMRPDHPPALRRRARLLGIAVLISFGLPSLELLIFPFIGEPPLEIVVPNLLCLATFPLMVGYAILRYQLFDLRIVLRRGAVYATLSLTVSLAFVAMVLLLVDVVGTRAQSTAALWLTSMTLVVGIGLLQLRVQAWVDRWANRKRDRYARAVEAISEDLVRAHTVESATEIARRAFLETMRLSRAYVAIREDDKVSCFMLGNTEDPETGAAPPELPASFDAAAFPPVARALALGEMTTAYDPGSMPSVAGATPLGGEFWAYFGLEVVVPLVRRSAGERATIGLLLLGPRRDGQPLDIEDRNLIPMLANQLTIAAENAFAFEQIRALKEGLEDQVRARTRELERALADLQGAEAHLIESEKQAMLGRLVAGIVHEVNTPLGSLTSSADTLQRVLDRLEQRLAEHPDPEVQGLAELVRPAKPLTDLQRDSAQRLSGLISSLKSFVSLDEASFREVDVREGIDSALRLLSNDLGEQVRVHRDYPSHVPHVRAPAQRLNQVFLHVLQNAAKAIDGEGDIRIALEEEPDMLCVRVSDTGRGIPDGKQKDLFDFGFTTKGGRMGLRLGLPSSKRTLRELGGDIKVVSAEGAGTTVHIHLPVRGDRTESSPAV